MKRKVQETSSTPQEQWQPTELEIRQFCEMMKEFTEWKPERDLEFTYAGKTTMKRLSAGTVYKSPSRLMQDRAMAKFEAVTESVYMGQPHFAVRIHQTTNSFMKSGEGKLALYYQFPILEKIFFRREWGKQQALNEREAQAPQEYQNN